jgi:hypothetical protein
MIYEVAVKKEVFVCDHCGIRKRLDASKRHWCENCASGSPVEMRPARDKRTATPANSSRPPGQG